MCNVRGTVGIAVASGTRDLQFKSRHQYFLFTLDCIEKTKIKGTNQAGNGPLTN